MTLGELFKALSENPAPLLGYHAALPLTALLAGVIGKDEGHLSPWKQLYAALIYLAAVPGVFAVVLSFYFWLFERRPILETDLYIQVLPLISMGLTFWLIRRNVDLQAIPGFGKLSGLLTMVFVVLLLMWLIDRTHILAITFLPFWVVLLMLAVLLVLFRFGWKRVFEGR